MVVNIGRALAGDWHFVGDDIRAVVEAARSARRDHQSDLRDAACCRTTTSKSASAKLSEAAGAAFVKTSTGFGLVKGADGGMIATGATEHDIRLMRATCGPPSK